MPFQNGCHDSASDKPNVQHIDPKFKIDWTKINRDFRDFKMIDFAALEKKLQEQGSCTLPVGYAFNEVSQPIYARHGKKVYFDHETNQVVIQPEAGENWRITYKAGHQINGQTMPDTTYTVRVTRVTYSNIEGTLIEATPALLNAGTQLTFAKYMIANMEMLV